MKIPRELKYLNQSTSNNNIYTRMRTRNKMIKNHGQNEQDNICADY